MICQICGTESPEGSRFCRECGARLSETDPVRIKYGRGDGQVQDAQTLQDSENETKSDSPEASVSEHILLSEESSESFETETSDEPDERKSGENVSCAENLSEEGATVSGDLIGAAPGGRRRRRIPVIVIAAVIVLIIAVNVIFAMIPTTQERWQEQYDLGQQYLLEMDYEQAIVAFTAAIEIDENVADAYISRAEAYLGTDMRTASTDNQELALSDYTAALAIDDTLTDVYVRRGDLYVLLGSDEENMTAAISDYSAALNLDETLTDVYVRRGDLYVLSGSDEENVTAAISDYSAALNLDETLTDVYVSRGDLYAALGAEEENLLAAISDYNSALALDGSRTTLYVSEAEIYVTLADHEGAASAYTNAIEGGLDTSDIYLGRAESYYALGMEESGEQETDTELSEKSREYLTASAADYRTVIDLGDVAEENYTKTAEIYILLGDYDSAALILDEADDLYPGSEAIIELTQKVAELIVEREYQAYLAQLRQMIEDSWWDDVTRFVELLQLDPDAITESDWLNADLYSYLVDELEEILIWDYDDGQYLAFYPGGPVYYGEMEGNERSGQGILIWADTDPDGGDYEMHVYEGPWSGNLPNGTGTYCKIFNSSIQTSHTCFTIDFIDGVSNGTGSAEVVVNGRSADEESYTIEAEDGELVLRYTAPNNSKVSLLVTINGTYWSYGGSTLCVDDAFVGLEDEMEQTLETTQEDGEEE